MTTAEIKVFAGGGQSTQAACLELASDIKALVYRYSGRLPLAAVLGVLEIVKSEIIDDHR